MKARELWSNEEEVHMRPGHRFGDADNGTSCEIQFNLSHHTWEDYRDTGFYKQDWLNRVEEDASGLTFQEWTPDVDTSRARSGTAKS